MYGDMALCSLPYWIHNTHRGGIRRRWFRVGVPVCRLLAVALDDTLVPGWIHDLPFCSRTRWHSHPANQLCSTPYLSLCKPSSLMGGSKLAKEVFIEAVLLPVSSR